jgi:hypothetical protein
MMIMDVVAALAVILAGGLSDGLIVYTLYRLGLRPRHLADLLVRAWNAISMAAKRFTDG